MSEVYGERERDGKLAKEKQQNQLYIYTLKHWEYLRWWEGRRGRGRQNERVRGGKGKKKVRSGQKEVVKKIVTLEFEIVSFLPVRVNGISII